MQSSPVSFKSGFVGLVGKPNVGKSTLLNTLLNQKVAAVSPRPQTTRKRQLGILTSDTSQIIFVDTPGIHTPHHKLGDYMNEVANETLGDVDILLWMVDGSQMPNDEDRLVSSRMAQTPNLPPVILVLNKSDLVKNSERDLRLAAYQDLLPRATPLWITALGMTARQQVIELLESMLPEGVPYYDADQITDLYERDIAADLIREAALIHLRDEIPHSIAVRIDEYIEQSETNAHITATIMIERESHKGILIGKGGEMIKKIGMTARKEIEKMSERKIYLELRVKENKNWRNNQDSLRLLGYVSEKDND